jgi:hypothetical protein
MIYKQKGLLKRRSVCNHLCKYLTFLMLLSIEENQVQYPQVQEETEIVQLKKCKERKLEEKSIS